MSGWKLSSVAREDLLDALMYGLSTFGEAQALKYRASLERSFDNIAAFPRMSHERAEFSPPLRIHHHVSHYIAYTIETDHVLIVRVVKDDADLDALFGPF